jgi:predicted phage-related endonuclease
MLTEEQLTARLNVLGGSDMGCLMRGERDAIDQLWRVKTGLEPAEDLSDVWPVQLGVTTEQLNLNWYERKQRQTVSRRGEIVKHYYYAWAACTLDGWIDELECPIEAKHVGGREPLEVIIERYQPQLQWQCEVTGADQVALSLIVGVNQPIVEFIERDEGYANAMVKRGALFMEHVRNRTPPVELPAVPAPIDATKIYDMSDNNQWGHYAGIWYELRDSAAAHEEAVKILKSLVPPDAKKAHGHGISITRSRIGRLSLREE